MNILRVYDVYYVELDGGHIPWMSEDPTFTFTTDDPIGLDVLGSSLVTPETWKVTIENAEGTKRIF